MHCDKPVPTGATFLQIFHFLGSIFEIIKAANTGIMQLNFINIPKNVSNTFFPSLNVSISKHLHCTKPQSPLRDPGPV